MKTGRPLTQIDWRIVEECCGMFCTGEEIARILGISYDTLGRAIRREHGMRFAEYFRQKSARGKAALRRAQFELAMDGNSTMLIWLGKQWLGQRETRYLDNSGSLIVDRIVLRFDSSIQSESAKSCTVDPGR